MSEMYPKLCVWCVSKESRNRAENGCVYNEEDVDEIIAAATGDERNAVPSPEHQGPSSVSGDRCTSSNSAGIRIGLPAQGFAQAG